MRIGIPKEIKTLEGRVALIPDAVAELVKAGHEVFIESQAGHLSGYSDEAYKNLGAQIMPDAASLYGAVKLIVKVKEPQPDDLNYIREDHLLFCYLHLAAELPLMRRLLDIGTTAVAFETVTENNTLPLLAPMSDIAGRIAAQAGVHYLHAPLGGKGVLMGGLPATKRGNAVVIGGGVAGGNATRLLQAFGANVTVFDMSRDRLQEMRALGPNVTALYPYKTAIADSLTEADLVIGAVLIPGAKAPYVVTNDMVSAMQPKSVIVDISVDQGGCIETTKPTTYASPTYEAHGVVHFAVTNMPGAVPRMASQALSAAITPYVLRLTQADWQDTPALKAGLNVQQGEICLEPLKELLN